MRWCDARSVVEGLRADTRLYLPALTTRRGFSSPRVEYLLNGLVAAMPEDEIYLEVGTLEGRTLEAAAVGNDEKRLVGCDPGDKYVSTPADFPPSVEFWPLPWWAVLPKLTGRPVGVAFYDGDHGAGATAEFIAALEPRLAADAVLVLDDWDRESVRAGALHAFRRTDRWRLVAEMPEYGDGLTCPPQRFGYQFGVSVWGWTR
jgi:methyltransferase family protein